MEDMTLFTNDPNQGELNIVHDIDPTVGYTEAPFTASSLALGSTIEQPDQLTLTLQ